MEQKKNLLIKLMIFINYDDCINNVIDQFLEKRIPEFLAWNERKNGNQLEYKFLDRYSKDDNPDDDFIDLDALIRNVANSIIREGHEVSIPEIFAESLLQENNPPSEKEVRNMKILKLEIELKYDAQIMHGNDKESIDWFNSRRKNNLRLHSNEIGDELGKVKVIEFLTSSEKELSKVMICWMN